MFNFLKRKSADSKQNNERSMVNPTFLFSQFGPDMSSLWSDIVEGEHKAVEQYVEFLWYYQEVSCQYSDINFDEFMVSIMSEDGNNCIDLTRGQVMYLALFSFCNDIYLSDESENSLFILTKEKYQETLQNLLDSEKQFCTRIKKYFCDYIVPKINAVSRLRWDIDICEYSVPLNTMKCRDYHQYIANEEYDSNAEKHSEWNYIFAAPIYDYHIKKDNPLIPININILDAFVLDCVCYINIAIPTLDLFKVLRCRPDNDKSVMEVIVSKFGDGVDKFIYRSIRDFSTANFRKWVTEGLLVQ